MTPHDAYRFKLNDADTCPKCNQEGEDPRLVYAKPNGTTGEQIRVFCATCGWEAPSAPCADAPT